MSRSQETHTEILPAPASQASMSLSRRPARPMDVRISSSVCVVMSSSFGRLVVTDSRGGGSPENALFRGVPGGTVGGVWLIPDRVTRRAYNLPQGRQSSMDGPDGSGLDEEAAKSGSLLWTRDHRKACGVGGQLAEQFGSDAAADDVHHLDGMVGCLL